MAEVSELKKGRDGRGRKEERVNQGGQMGLRMAQKREVTFLRSLGRQIMVREVGW